MCCSPWGCQELDTTEQLNWAEGPQLTPLVTPLVFYVCVYFCFVNKFICIIFFNSAHKSYDMTFVFFPLLTSLNMIISRSIHVAANGIISFLLWLSNSPFPRWLSRKESTWQCRKCRFGPWVGKIPWSRKWQLTTVFLPRKLYRRVTEKPTGLKSMGSQRIRQDWAHIHI